MAVHKLTSTIFSILRHLQISGSSFLELHCTKRDKFCSIADKSNSPIILAKSQEEYRDVLESQR